MKSRSGRLRRRFGTVAATASLLLGAAGVIAAPAVAAEDTCEGSFSDLPSGSALPCNPPSNYWDDGNTNPITALNLTNCSTTPEVTLQRWNGSVWTNLGPRRLAWCVDTGGWQTWSDVPAGRYRIVIVDAR